jgi:hypothetical protein
MLTCFLIAIAERGKSFGVNCHPMGTIRLRMNPIDLVRNEHLHVEVESKLFLLTVSLFTLSSKTNPSFTSLSLANRFSETSYFIRSTFNS